MKRNSKRSAASNSETLDALHLLRHGWRPACVGVTVPYSKTSQHNCNPVPVRNVNGKTLTHIHKTSAEAFEYPPYVTPVPPDSKDIVIAESELKAAMVFQLGDQVSAFKALAPSWARAVAG